MPSSRPVIPVEVGAVAEMRKPHACGGIRWTVTRVGMDIGLQCNQCSRRVLLPRSQFERRLRRFIPSGEEKNNGTGT